MTGMQIVREEMRRIAVRMLPLTLIAFGVLVLLGGKPVETAISLLVGLAYALFLFWMIGKNAVRAVCFAPEQATRRVRRGYVLRYLLTAVVVYGAIRLPYLNTIAVILPLFFPKVVLLWSTLSNTKAKGG